MEHALRSQIDALEKSHRANSPEKADLLDKAYRDIAACASTALPRPVRRRPNSPCPMPWVFRSG